MDQSTADKLNELLVIYRRNHDYEIGEEIVRILGDTDFWFSADDQEASPPPQPKPAPEVCFFSSCKYGYACSRCAQRQEAGSAMFAQKGTKAYWCADCASDEEKAATTTYWTNYKKKQNKETHEIIAIT